MAPTEILAEQHLRTLRALVEPLGLAVAWLSAGQRAREREAALDALRTGTAAIGVGTHALIQDAVELHRLGLAVVDEQHRFGVLQRASLRGKGEHPHVLVMTATPIPRTLALTLYGDLDVSVLDELPPGRTPIRTDWRREPARERIYDFVRGELRAGRQAYVVCPLVEETEASDLKAATEMAERLQTGPFREFRVGLVHGRLSFDAKDRVMRAFKAGELDLLVATTVIEVGIDVPNASVMVVEHAERFGLAQLHQLRGRVGRGTAQSYCILLVNEPMSDEARQRIDAMAKTQDGFRLAEVDLGIRGPGEFFGTRQSGLPEFRAGSLLTHARLLEEARQDAMQLVARDPGLRLPEHRALREALVARWRERLELGVDPVGRMRIIGGHDRGGGSGRLGAGDAADRRPGPRDPVRRAGAERRRARAGPLRGHGRGRHRGALAGRGARGVRGFLADITFTRSERISSSGIAKSKAGKNGNNVTTTRAIRF